MENVDAVGMQTGSARFGEEKKIKSQLCEHTLAHHHRTCCCGCNKWIYAKNTFFSASGVVQFSKSYIISICLYIYTFNARVQCILCIFESTAIRRRRKRQPRQRRLCNVGKNLKRHQHINVEVARHTLRASWLKNFQIAVWCCCSYVFFLIF